MEFSNALKIFFVISLAYMFCIFAYFDYFYLIEFPNPPIIHNYDFFSVVKFIIGLIVYIVMVIIIMIINIVSIMGFSFIPFPFNIFVSLIVNSLYIYSIIIIVREVVRSVSIPLPI